MAMIGTLQENGRISVSELGRKVSLSLSIAGELGGRS
jgi:DNA-binding Lrp family transcriptional regulator